MRRIAPLLRCLNGLRPWFQSPSNPVEANLRRQFLVGMRDLGYVEERHFKMEDRNADGHLDRLPPLASELVHLSVEILLVGGQTSIRAAKDRS